MGISACSVTCFSCPLPSSVVKVAASADLLGGGAGGGALGAASANPVWRRLGGGAFILRIQVRCPFPLGLSLAFSIRKVWHPYFHSVRNTRDPAPPTEAHPALPYPVQISRSWETTTTSPIPLNFY